MILTTHAVAGAATAILLREHPWVALVAAFLSHFVLDAIPHWHYPIRSLIRNQSNPLKNRLSFGKDFSRDIVKTGIDCELGIILAIVPVSFLFPDRVSIAFLGAAAGILPDFLQLIFHLFPRSPLYYLQWFHQRVHAKTHLDAARMGIFAQAFLTLLFLLVIIS